MKIIATAAMPWEPTPVNTRGGKVSRKRLIEGELLPGVGMYARLVKYHEGEGVFSAPRHKHNYDQIRFTLSGVQDFGHGQISQANWPCFFPAGAPYGPERIEGAEVIVIQWGAMWVDQQKNDAAVAEMTEVGEFKGGIYQRIDENGVHHNADSIEAIWEKVWGRKLEYPKPKYPQPILMDPDAFDWTSDGPERSVKSLGTFTDQDIRMKFVRWDTKSDLQFDADRTSMLYSLEGDLVVDGNTYGPQTAVWSLFGETGSVTGAVGARAVTIDFPKQQSVSQS